MTPKDKTDWLETHIPYRVRAALARIPLQVELLKLPQFLPAKSRIETRCEGDAIWEGRLAATRWLIEFIGVSADQSGKPKIPARWPHDARVDDIGGKVFCLSRPEAVVLANVWLGCSKASSHATNASGHPPVNEKEISDALRIVMAHLDQELYSGAGQKIAAIALRPNP